MSDTSDIKTGFLTMLGNKASHFVEEFLPDAFIFVLLLTFLVMILATVFTSSGPIDVITHWGRGFWYVLSFSMQSTLALVTGWALADSPPIKRVLHRVAKIPDTQYQALFLTAVVGVIFGLFQWGVVLIASAIFAREIGIAMEEKNVKVHYPLLVATAYAGLLPWHQGLSGAAPLLVATPGNFLENSIGVIPVSQTIFSPANLIIVAGVVMVIVVVMPLMAPDDENQITVIPEDTLRAAQDVATDGGTSTSDKPHESKLKTLLLDSNAFCIGLGILVWAYLLYLFATEGFLGTFNLNIAIVVLLGLGFFFHGTLRSYITVLQNAVEGASQIIIQFQFYGGIMGIMAWSGLAALIAATAAHYSTSTTWYLGTFLSAGIINFFVPAGGGQWVVTGKVLTNAAAGIPGTQASKTVIAFAMGDEWTNMIQPFWAIPLLGIAELSIRDIMGYAAVLCIASGIVMATGALLMGIGII